MRYDLACDQCGKEFTRDCFPSVFKKYKSHCCGKRCAALLAKSKSPSARKGIVVTIDGHIYWRTNTHPRRNKNNQVPLAHLLMESQFGRFLYDDEVVHHIDGNPTNNDLSNLQLMTLGEHVTLHNNLKPRSSDGRFIKTMS